METPLQPPKHRGTLVIREIEPGDLVQLAENLGEGGPLLLFEPVLAFRQLNDAGLVPIFDELLGERRDGQREVDQTRREGAFGHALVLGLLGGLHHRGAPRFFDRTEADCTVAARTGHHNPDRVLALIRRQRPKEAIDRRGVVGCRGRFDLQPASVDGEALAGGHDVDATAGHLRLILCLHHTERRFLLKDVCQAALHFR